MAQNRVEIEGSEARAADRGRPDGFGFFAEETAPTARYLGDPADVTEIVREYLAGAHDIRSRAAAGGYTGDGALDALKALASRYQSIFLGRDAAYRSMPFNSPAGLGGFIKSIYPSDDDNEEAVRSYLIYVATLILDAEAKYQADEITEDAAEFLVASTIEDATKALMGVRYDPSEE